MRSERRTVSWALGGWALAIAATLTLRLFIGEGPGADLAHLTQRRATLEEEIRLLESQKSLLERYGHLGSNFRPVTGELLPVDLSPRRRGALLNVGREDGIRVGQAVVDPSGVVGRVHEVSAAHSWIVLADDPEFRIVVETGPGSGHAVARGGPAPLELRSLFHANATPPPLGSTVVTRGGDGIHPRGLVVGEVTAQEPGAGYRVRLPRDPTRVRAVAVLTFVDGS